MSAPKTKVKLHKTILTSAAVSGLSGQAYSVYVTNKSDWNIIAWKKGVNGTWHYLPEPIKRTCTTSCQDCWRSGKYKLIHTVDCTTDPYDLYLAGERGGAYLYLEPARISPTCQENGTSVCVDRDD
jgi:hypothetical protein